MSVTAQTPVNSYTANGVTTVFPFGFTVLNSADLRVRVNNAPLAEGVDYTVSGVGLAEGGDVTLLAAPAAGQPVLIYRSTQTTRDTDYQSNGDLPAATLNTDFDRLWYALQEVVAGLIGDAPSPGDLTLRNDLASAVGATLLGYRNTLVSGPTVRTVADKLNHASVDAFDLIPQAQHAAIIAGTSTYNAAPDIQRGLNEAKHVVLPPYRFFIGAGLAAVQNGSLTCRLGRATLVADPALTDLVTLTIDADGFTLDGINFDGGNLGPWNVAAPVSGARVGIDVGGTPQRIHITVRNCDVRGYNLIGVRGSPMLVGYSSGKRVVFDNVNCHQNYVNWWLEPLCEYVTMTNCYGYLGFAGIIVQGGNNTVTASHFEYNYENGQLAGGENNAHGQFVGCSFNHGVSAGLNADGVTFGHLFVGCAFWYAPIILTNCTGIMISHGQIVNSTIRIDGGGKNMINENWTSEPLAKTFVGTTFTTFRDNQTKATDNTPDSHWGDLFVDGNRHRTLSYPVAWNATSDTDFPLGFTSLMYNGVSSSFLDDTGRVYLPQPGKYLISALIRFDALGAAEKPVLTLLHREFGGTTMETIKASCPAAASTTDNALHVSTVIMAGNGDSLTMRLRSATGTGISIPAGGIRLKVSSIN